MLLRGLSRVSRERLVTSDAQTTSRRDRAKLGSFSKSRLRTGRGFESPNLGVRWSRRVLVDVEDRSVVRKDGRDDDFLRRTIRVHEFIQHREGAVAGGVHVIKGQILEGGSLVWGRVLRERKNDGSSASLLILSPRVTGRGFPMRVHEVVE